MKSFTNLFKTTLFLIILFSFPVVFHASSDIRIPASEQEAKDIIAECMEEYPDGSLYGEEKFTWWEGGIFTDGHGCAAFAFTVSDKIFGEDAPARMICSQPFMDNEIAVRPGYSDYLDRIVVGDVADDLRAGDIIGIGYCTNNEGHASIITDVCEDHIVVGEGNVAEGVVHWGRVIPCEDIEERGSFVLTRWPENEN